MEYYRWRNDNGQSIVFEYENNIAKRIELTYNNEKLVLNILDVLGASNAVVYNVETATRMPTKLCLKIAPSGTINLDENKIHYINSHSEDFTRIYYFQNNIELPAPIIFKATKKPNKTREWQNFDLLLMEKTPYTLDGILNKLPDNYHLSINVLNCLLMSLIRMCNNMVEAGYYYTDLKPANIGIVKYKNGLTFKLIDVDSLFNDYHYIHTEYTTGIIQRKYNFIRIQYLNMFFTVFAVLFNDKADVICANDFGISKINNNIVDFISNIDNYSLTCSHYKYTIIIGTISILQYLCNENNIDNLSANIINEYYNFMCEYVANYLSENQSSELFNFVSCMCVAMVYIILQKNSSNIIKFIHTNFNIENNEICYFLADESMYEQSIFPMITIGLGFVNIFYKIITKICNDDNCSNITYSGNLIYNN